MKILRLLGLMGTVAAIILVSYWMGQQAYGWMPPQATQEARKVDILFSFLVSLGTAVFLSVTGMISWSLLTCRAKCGDFSEGHPSRGDARLEILWTLGPTVLVLWIALQSQGIYQLLSIDGLNTLHKNARASEVPSSHQTAPLPTIEVMAKQWGWTFHYPGQNITSHELHLPAGQAVKLILESEDVLHGFYVPEFRVKQDIVPNHKIDFIVIPKRIGKYRLHDSQFSGTYFALMAADVYVEAPEQFRDWLFHPSAQGATASLAELEYARVNAAASQNHPLLGSRWPTIVPKQFAS